VITESVLIELQRATHASLQRITGALAGLDLGASELNALANLADGAARTVSALGTAIGTRPTTLTGVLDRLERRGLITRGVRAGDRRAVLIELTADGRATAEAVRAAFAEVEGQALDGFPAEVLDHARAVLRALAEPGR
jgi:DNA-binding MarR family transcriptional regulator